MSPRNLAWMVALSFPVWFIPGWVACWNLAGVDWIGATTATGGIVLVLVSLAAYHDVDSFTIPNWITYSGILWAWLLNAFHSWSASESVTAMLGTVGILPSLVGFAILFVGLLVVTSFSGGGAGDVKLGGAIGAFLGFANGFEALVLAFVLSAVVSLVLILIGAFARTKPSVVATDGGAVEASSIEADSKSSNLMRQKIRLGPFFALGTVLVLVRESGIIDFALLGN